LHISVVTTSLQFAFHFAIPLFPFVLKKFFNLFFVTYYAGPVSPTSPVANGKLVSAVSSPKMSANGSRKSSPPSMKPTPSTYSPGFYVPTTTNNNSTFSSDTPPSTTNSINSTQLKSELSALKLSEQKKSSNLSEDTNSLSSSKSSSSISKKFSKIFRNNKTIKT
jgi:hypothetical protein